MRVDAKKLIELLRAARGEFGTFERSDHSDGRWGRWVHQTDAILRNSFGSNSPERQQFTTAIDWGGMITGPTEDARQENRNKRFEQILKRATSWLDALMFQVETFGVQGIESHEDTGRNDWTSRLYLYTSPVYLAKRSLDLLGDGWRWCMDNKAISAVVGIVSLIGAVVTILLATGAIGT